MRQRWPWPVEPAKILRAVTAGVTVVASVITIIVVSVQCLDDEEIQPITVQIVTPTSSPTVTATVLAVQTSPSVTPTATPLASPPGEPTADPEPASAHGGCPPPTETYLVGDTVETTDDWVAIRTAPSSETLVIWVSDLPKATRLEVLDAGPDRDISSPPEDPCRWFIKVRRLEAGGEYGWVNMRYIRKAPPAR